MAASGGAGGGGRRGGGGGAGAPVGKVAAAKDVRKEYTHNDSTIVMNIKGTSEDRYKIDRLKAKFIEAGGSDPR